ncbi:MAG: Smr/MutS family protein, partial [Myxococcaceae bacterium]|nr:Smr/MutS family protein [Myxococcaceae bacterium]
SEKVAAQARAELQTRVEDIQKRTAALRAELAVGQLAQAPVTVRPGAWVHHVGLGRDVEVVALGEKDALVAAGPLKMRVPLEELGHSLRAKPQQKFPSADKQAAALARAEEAKPSEMRLPNLQVDVRGMRAEEAIRELESSLDRAMRVGEEGALVIHGHGTGALKQAVRDYLTHSPYVRMYRPGESHEGGDGVTLISLRS